MTIVLGSGSSRRRRGTLPKRDGLEYYCRVACHNDRMLPIKYYMDRRRSRYLRVSRLRAVPYLSICLLVSSSSLFLLSFACFPFPPTTTNSP